MFLPKASLVLNYVASQLTLWFLAANWQFFNLQYTPSKKNCTLANILESNQIHCTTANIFDWLTKTGIFLNHFVSLLETWFSATILEFLQIHCISPIMMNFLPKLWNFFIYITWLLKNKLAARISETHELPA